MLKHLLHILCLSAVLLPSGLAAQGLPTLSKASEYNTGTLPDGITYYIVPNTTSAGLADFTLVCRGWTDTDTARSAMVDLPHFNGSRPAEFLARSCVGYSRGGFISHVPGATLYHFENVPVESQSVSDSTLLMLFDLALKSKGDQAVVVCGNVDVARISERMQMLSMMVPRRDKAQDSDNYRWTAQDKALVEFTRGRIGSLTLTYRSPRTEKNMMNTLQPVMSNLFATELGMITRTRVEQRFTAEGIPVASIRFRYMASDASSGDETFTISIDTDPGKVMAAAMQLGAILADLDNNGATQEEINEVRTSIKERLGRTTSNVVTTNAQYTRKCVASYLYGASLASAATIGGIFDGRRLDDDTEVELFNRFAKAMLDRNRNLTINYSSPKDHSSMRDEVLAAFHNGWDSGAATAFTAISCADTTRLFKLSKKVKLKTETTESYTGGKMWVFTNGMKVIYKKTALKGEFQFGLLTKGGFAGVQGLKSGEGEFVGDMFGLERVSGMSADEFTRLLAVNGIEMTTSASLTDWRITGSAPSSRSQLVMRALLSAMNERTPDKEAFERWKTEEALRLKATAMDESSIFSRLDSIACPDSKYPKRRNIITIQDNLPERAEAYFARQASNMGNGVLVILGDLNEDALKKLLCRSLGNFHTGSQRSVRPNSTDEPVPMWYTFTEKVPGQQASLTVQMTALQEFNMSKFMAFRLTAKVLEKQIKQEFAMHGTHVELIADAESVPSERFTLQMVCSPCPTNSVPADVQPAAPRDALNMVRRAINHLLLQEPSKADMDLCKNLLTKEVASEGNLQNAMMTGVLARNSEGKDLTTSYAGAISSVTPAQVQAILKALDSCRIEYVRR